MKMADLAKKRRTGEPERAGGAFREFGLCGLVIGAILRVTQALDRMFQAECVMHSPSVARRQLRTV